MQIFTEDEIKYGMEIAPGIHYKDGRFIYDNWRVYLKIHLPELVGIAFTILGIVSVIAMMVN